MNRFSRFGYLLVVLLLWHSVSLESAAAVVIGGWDLTRGGFGSVMDAPEQAGTRALIQLISPGASVTGTNTLTPAYLSTIDVLLLGAQNSSSTVITPLSASEQTALFDFVAAGGNAAIVTEREPQGGAGGDAARESLLDPFGMDTMGDSPATTATFVNPLHPIAGGPFGTITQFGLSNYGWYDNLGSYANALATEDAFGQPVLAVIENGAIAPGSGRVVFLSDGNALDDGALNSLALAGNALSYLIPVPEPSSIALAMGGSLGLFFVASRRRRHRSKRTSNDPSATRNLKRENAHEATR